MSRRRPPAAVASRAVLCAATPLSPRAAQLLALLQDGPYRAEHRAEPGPEPAAVVIWTGDALPSAPLPAGPTLHVIDRHGAGPEDWTQRPGVGLILVGSEAEYGAHAARDGSVPVAVVPFAPPPDPRGFEAFDTLLLIQGRDPAPETLDRVGRAAAWAASRGIRAGVADASGPAGLEGIRRAGARPGPGRGTLVLDARGGPPAALTATPDALVAAMAAGAPVLCCGPTPLAAALDAHGAGGVLEAVEAGLDDFAALPLARMRAMSEAARRLAAALFSPEEAAAALRQALASGTAAARQRALAWMQDRPGRGPGGHVLVISDEALNLVDIRVHLPFEVLHRRGAIDGYTLLRHGEFAAGSSPATPAQRFDAIWVHRSVETGVQLLLELLGRPFVYDADDNLLVSPAYRTAFPAETIDTARALLRDCAVLSCATPTLFGLLQLRSADGLLAKAVVTPNLAHGTPHVPLPGPPRAVVWASSDQPALTGSRPEVERAVRDFCLAHGLRLVCVGAAPPTALAESEVEIEHIGLLSYPGYLARLRGLAPAILVGPLETGADSDTQDFIDGKSDVKVMEARLSGLVGVFSRARPYVESDLAPPILCDNTYESWLDGLERAARLCAEPRPPQPWPARRAADRLGPMAWADALTMARLPVPLTAGELTDAIRFVRQQQESLLGSQAAFDEDYYLARHEDVRIAVEQGVVASGYQHYVHSGAEERRAARRRRSASGESEFWWARLLQTVSRVERDVTSREDEIQRLRARLALRRGGTRRAEALPAPAAAPLAAPARAHPSIDLVWHPPGAMVDQPCPVCDTPGPHPVLLRADAETLIRCRRCAACFYERRVVYDYEREQDAAVLRQLYLEQNASIYHQTRFLFAIDDAGIDSVLDVGCGFGYPVDVAAKVLGWRATGIDPSFYAADGAVLLEADIRKAYLTDDSELGDPYGLVMASEVIEHVPDPYAFLAVLRRWLRPGGTLVLTTPDAAALQPGIGPGSLIGILALKVHLILFSKEALALALRRAGFRHVQVESAQDGLVACASDRPLRFRADSAERHVQAYRRYLEHLVETAEPGSPLWNGGVGRLFALLAGDAELPVLHALFARIAAAWRQRFGIDLARLRLPALLGEPLFAAGDPRTKPAGLAATQPLNLAGVLFNRAVLEWRTPGRTPEAVLAYARPAYLCAVQTRRVLQAEDMIDLDLKLTAWRARALIVDCLAELAPEVEGEMLRGLAEPSPGELHDRVDLPDDALVGRITPYFSRAVQDDRFDEARRLEPWMRDLDLICTANAAAPEALFRGLFTVGVLHLVGEDRPEQALAAFERMEAETRRRLADPTHGPLAREFFRVAQEHVRLAAARLAPEIGSA